MPLNERTHPGNHDYHDDHDDRTLHPDYHRHRHHHSHRPGNMLRGPRYTKTPKVQKLLYMMHIYKIIHTLPTTTYNVQLYYLLNGRVDVVNCIIESLPIA